MTPSYRLSRPDLKKLSAYVDGALPPRERAALEARLATEADLQLALEELRFVSTSLRRMPAVPVPRNFTLTRDALPARRGRPYPALPFATALATLAFLVVFGWDAWAPRAALLGAQAPASEMEAEGSTLDTQADDVQALEMAAPAAPGESATADAYRFAAPGPTLCPGCPGPTPVNRNGHGEDEAEATRSAASGAPTPTSTPTPTPIPQPSDRPPPGVGPDLLDALKIALGALAVALAGATVLLRRK
ncbi:MAG: anti-sigma factor family protein [Anaerolineales bacterium]